MIAIQAVALAGGVGRDDMSGVAGMVDRKSQADGAAERLRKALARKAVLSAARDGAANVSAPPALVKLVGDDAAASLIDAEKKIVRLRLQEKQMQLQQKKGSVFGDPVGDRGDRESHLGPRGRDQVEGGAAHQDGGPAGEQGRRRRARRRRPPRTSSISRGGGARTTSCSPRQRAAASPRRRPT